MKKHFDKELVMTMKMMNISETLLNVGFVITLMIKVLLKQDAIVISLKNIDALHIELLYQR